MHPVPELPPVEPARRGPNAPSILLLALVAFCAGFSPACTPESETAIPTSIRSDPAAIGAAMPSLLELYRSFHEMPEISFQEERTAATFAEELRKAGLEVTERVGTYPTEGRTCYGVVGVFENGDGPTLLLRTDLDALPMREETGLPYASRATTVDESGATVPVMHACGHDVHMTSLIGATRVLTADRAAWRGTLVVIGQPAEERGAGARAMLADGLYERFPRPDYAIALHCSPSIPAGSVGVCEGYAMANVDSVDIHLRGRGGHGAYPHESIDPVVAAAQIVISLQTIVSRNISPFKPAVVTVGSIHAGTKHNIIPDEAHLQLTVRSYEKTVRKTLLDGIRRVATETAQAAGIPEDGITVTIDDREFTPSTYNDPALTRRLRARFAATFGTDQVIDAPPVMAGEDFSRYALDGEIPSCLFWLGTVSADLLARVERGEATLPSLHNSHFAPDADPAIETGVEALVDVAHELLAP